VIRSLIVAELARHLEVQATSIDASARFFELGLDSLGATVVLERLGEALGRAVPVTLAWRHPTVEALARHLAGESTTSAATRGGTAGEPIAIVGMSCRFPGAPDLASFWRLLHDGVDAIQEVPHDRWDASAVFSSDPAAPGKMNSRWGGFIDRVAEFDAAFVGISPREAAQMDPQQRILLELTWEALEQARLPWCALRGTRAGVYVGSVFNDYDVLQQQLGARGLGSHSSTGSVKAILANRISYALELSGPSMTIDTACSSSLVAVHLAAEALARGACDSALAAGVHLMLAPETSIAVSKFGALSPDGRCFTFDARANGYVRGEGAGVVLLKRLSDAMHDGDRVLALLRGGAVNNNGRSNGLTAPNPLAQEAVIAAALREAGVGPASVGYVELHGTGTALGDPIEASALASSYGAGRGEPLLVGSVKTNIGHLEAAAGMAGLIKTVLSLQHGVLPPSLHFVMPSPHIDFAASHLEVVTRPRPWPRQGDIPRRAGVSSFGFGGTNAHLVVEASPGEVVPLVLGAPDPAGLRAEARRLLAEVTASDDAGLARLVRRAAARLDTTTDWGAVVWGRGTDEVAEALAALVADAPHGRLQSGPRARQGRPALVLGGLGAQWRGMGRALLRLAPARAVLLRAERVLTGLGHAPLRRLLLDDGPLGDTLDDGDAHHVHNAAVVALEIAACEQLGAWGLAPAFVIGHSIGEIAAACVSGALGLEQALTVVHHIGLRYRATVADGRGAMAFVALPRAAVEGLGGVEVAAQNDPDSTVVCGERERIEALVLEWESRQVGCRLLGRVSAHGPLAAPAFADLAEVLVPSLGVPRAAAVPASPTMISSLTGEPVAPGELDAGYWQRNVTRPVELARALGRAAVEGTDLFIDASPHAVLERSIERCVAAQAKVIGLWHRGDDDEARLLAGLATAWLAGAPVDWRRVTGAQDEVRPELLVVSGRSEGAARAGVARLADALEDEVSLAAVAAELALGRSEHEHRVAVVAGDCAAARQALGAVGRGETSQQAQLGEAARTPGGVAWLFTGQGAQVAGMGRGLHRRWRAFREAMDTVLGALEGQLERPLVEVMWAAPGSAESKVLDETMYTQPALYALEVSLAALWVSWGVKPDVLLGHSIGELAAATVAGVMSVEDGARLVAARGRLMQAQPRGGAMAAVSLTGAEVQGLLVEGVEIAGVNGLRQVVVSGSATGVEAVCAAAAKLGARSKRLVVSHAFHSAQMDGMLAAYGEVAARVRYRPTTLPVVSNVSGKVAGEELGTAAYWVRQVRAAVQFAAGVQTAYGLGTRRFIELGPKGTLLGMVGESLEGGTEVTLVPSVRAGMSEEEGSLWSLGQWWTSGGQVGWDGVMEERRGVELPTYGWQRKRYWHERARQVAHGESTGHPLLGTRLGLAGGEAVYETVLGAEDEGWVGDHRVGQVAVLPGVGVAELMRAAGEARQGGAAVEVRGLVLQAPLEVAAAGTRVQVQVSEAGRVTVHSQKGSEGWTLHASAEVGMPAVAPATLELGELRARCREPVDVTAAYERFERLGLVYGPAFRALETLTRGEGEALAELRLPASQRERAASYGLHPVLLDAALQAALFAASDDEAYLPFELGRVTLHRSGAESGLARITRRRHGSDLLVDVLMTGEAGEPIAEIVGLRARRLVPARLEARAGSDADLHVLAWQEAKRAQRREWSVGRWLVLGDEADAQVRQILERLQAAGAPVTIARQATTGAFDHVLKLWPAQAREPRALLDEGLQIVQALARGPSTVRLWWMTAGAVAVEHDPGPRPELAALWGLGRTVRLEHPELDCRLIDVATPEAAGEVLLRELAIGDEERELAWRADERHALRLVRPPIRTGRERWHDDAGSLPSAGEVQIAIRAAGLAEGDAPGAIGRACAGTIIAVGAGVTGLAVGQRVMALAPAGGTCAAAVTLDARFVAPVPPALTFSQAAALPLPLVAAWQALRLGGLQQGQRVLVESASDAAGLVAAQLARHLGARVHCAAEPRGWPLVEALGLAHGGNLAAAESFLHATGYVGFDLVLRGRGSGALDLRRADGGWTRVDATSTSLDTLAKVAAEAGGELVELPIVPFHAATLDEALATVATGSAPGSVVVVPPARLDRDGTVLVTGGLGALGAAVARWLARRGVHHLLLVGRRGAATPGGAALVAELEALGSQVTTAAIDVADRAALAGVLAAIPRDRPLRAVVHAAGQTDDGILREQSAARFDRVLAAKLDGARHLDELTRELDLDAFVLFSSAAGALGSAGQGAYAAANAALDALAQARRRSGLPALSLGWGPWAEQGMAATLGEQQQRRVARRGFQPITPARGLGLLEAAWSRPEAHLVVAPLDLRAVASELGVRVPPVWQTLVRRPAAAAATATGAWVDELGRMEASARRRAVLQTVRAEIARALSWPGGEAVPVDRPLGELGLESHMAVELRNALGRRVGRSLIATLAFDHPTAAAITSHLLDDVLGLGSAPVPPAPPPPPAPEASMPVEQLVDFMDDLIRSMKGDS
jgi:acyl transferase domain-containing protein/acyl carrier protein